MAAADGDKIPTTFRWLHAARCTVASVVTMVAVVVIIRAIVVMLRPEKLQLWVAGGCVSVDKIISMPAQNVTIKFTLRAVNPSGRAYIDFTNLTVRIVDDGSAAAVVPEYPLPQDISVSQKVAHDALVSSVLTPPADMAWSYVRRLFEGGSISSEMEVKGLLTTHMMDRISRRDIPTTYYCLPVAIAVDCASSSASSDYGSRDVACLDRSEAPAFV